MKIRPILDKEKEEITTVDLSYLRAVKKQLEKRLEDTVFPNAAVLNLTPDTDADMKKKVEDAENFETSRSTLAKPAKTVIIPFFTPIHC